MDCRLSGCEAVRLCKWRRGFPLPYVPGPPHFNLIVFLHRSPPRRDVNRAKRTVIYSWLLMLSSHGTKLPIYRGFPMATLVRATTPVPAASTAIHTHEICTTQRSPCLGAPLDRRIWERHCSSPLLSIGSLAECTPQMVRTDGKTVTTWALSRFRSRISILTGLVLTVPYSERDHSLYRHKQNTRDFREML